MEETTTSSLIKRLSLFHSVWWVLSRGYNLTAVWSLHCIVYSMHLKIFNTQAPSPALSPQLHSSLGPYTQLKASVKWAKCLCACVCVCCFVAREFGRWKVNSLAVEKREGFGGSGSLALPLDPDFIHTVRQLGRQPTLKTITESLIKKYGTHFLLSATLGGRVVHTKLQRKPHSQSY